MPCTSPTPAAHAPLRLSDHRLPDGCALKAGGEPENLPEESSHDDGLSIQSRWRGTVRDINEQPLHGREGNKTSWKSHETGIREIAELVNGGISAETISQDTDGMLVEG